MTFFFIIRAARGYEEKVAEGLAHNARLDDIPLKSILATPNLSGFVIVECDRKVDLIQALRGVKRARGVLGGKTSLDEVVSYLEMPEPRFKEDEVIDIIAGPFRGVRAKVAIDDGGSRLTVIPLEWEHGGRVVISKDQVRR